jgi:hypothetical protein
VDGTGDNLGSIFTAENEHCLPSRKVPSVVDGSVDARFIQDSTSPLSSFKY